MQCSSIISHKKACASFCTQLAWLLKFNHKVTSTKFNQFSQQWDFLDKNPRNVITVPPPKQQKNWIYTVKSMLEKIIYTAWNGHFLDHDKFCCAFLQYRNTPSRKDELPQAQKLYGGPTQDTLPTHRRSFSKEPVATSSRRSWAINLLRLVPTYMCHGNKYINVSVQTVCYNLTTLHPINLRLLPFYSVLLTIVYCVDNTRVDKSTLQPTTMHILTPYRDYNWFQCCYPTSSYQAVGHSYIESIVTQMSPRQ